MGKKPLIVVSLCAVVILVVASLGNVVGYQSVQTSQQNLIKERINQRELLFQTIVDIANNKEIQRIILKSQMSRGVFPTSEMHVLTKTQVRQMYFLGLILSKLISTSKIHSMIEKYNNNQVIQKEIKAVVEKNTKLHAEISQLSNLGHRYKSLDLSNFLSFVIRCIIACILIFFILVSGVIFIPSYISYLVSNYIYTHVNDDLFFLILRLGCMKWALIWGSIFIDSLLFLLLVLFPYSPEIPHRLTN